MAAAPPKKRKTAAPSFAEGDRVECFFRDWEQYFPATVSRMNDDLTYDVDYDDGYAEKNLPAKLLKPPKPPAVSTAQGGQANQKGAGRT